MASRYVQGTVTKKYSKMALMQHLLFLTQKTLAFYSFSGIITTNLGKTATHTEIAGRKRRIHHSKIYPFP